MVRIFFNQVFYVIMSLSMLVLKILFDEGYVLGVVNLWPFNETIS